MEARNWEDLLKDCLAMVFEKVWDFLITKKMEARNWDDLPKDCLAMVFQKVGVPASARNVPFVSKSWRNVFLDPESWKHIDFFGLDPSSHKIKNAVDRSSGSAVDFKFPYSCLVKDLTYVSEKCPCLKHVRLPYAVSDHDQGLNIFPKLVARWKDLQLLELCTRLHFREILSEASIHCKNLTGLIVYGEFLWKEASVIVDSLPKIRCLKFRKFSVVDWEELEGVILKCKELEEVDVSHCIALKKSSTALMLRKAPHLKKFKTQGTRAVGKRKEILFTTFF